MISATPQDTKPAAPARSVARVETVAGESSGTEISAPGASSPTVESAPIASPVPAAAARLIERIDQVADQLATRTAEQATITLDLDGGHQVDVKVSLRGGRVFTDFRTDSPEMRVALAQGWESFVRGRENAGQRWATPVFSSALNAAPVVAPQPAPSSSGSFQGDASFSRQQSAAGQDQPSRRDTPAPDNAPATPVRPSAFRSAAAASAVELASTARHEPSRLLSALV